MKFRLLAIKPHKGCDKKFLKVLAIEQPYFFYNGYSIYEDRISSEDATSYYIELYKLENTSTIEISAIVGKNGSGKSTLIELMYAIIYNVSYVEGLIPEYDENEKKLNLETKLYASLYYQYNNTFYRIFCDGNHIKLFRQEGVKAKFKLVTSKGDLFKNFLNLFFYTIGMNYSHYSLNSLHQNRWLRHVFHKNDGYQTPLVINPFRNDGDISINNEEYLTLSRIATNLLTIRGPKGELYNELAPGKFASHIRFKLNTQKSDFGRFNDDVVLIIKEHRSEIIEAISKHFPNIKRALSKRNKSKYVDVAINYLCIKLYNITNRYKPYQKSNYLFIKRVRKLKEKTSTYSNYEFSISRLNNLLDKIRDQPSHITFKFFQAINFLTHIDYYKENVDKLISLPELANSLTELAEASNQELINVIPPSFFNIDIKFGNKGYLNTLSSGEKQKIYSTASWVYHVMNLISVKADRSVGYVRYKLINFVFDEIELYYHPDLQRTFIRDFIETLSSLPLRQQIHVNCIFVTHSPFILSDIPNTNILFLDKEGLPDKLAMSSHTFATNIHELLKNSFFLESGSMGAYAQNKIKSLITFLESAEIKNDEWTEISARKFIDLIGEPIIQSSIWSLYVKKFIDVESKTFLELEIARLQSKLQTK